MKRNRINTEIKVLSSFQKFLNCVLMNTVSIQPSISIFHLYKSIFSLLHPAKIKSQFRITNNKKI